MASPSHSHSHSHSSASPILTATSSKASSAGMQSYCASHGFFELSDAVDARLVLASKYILISDKIIKQLERIQPPTNAQYENGETKDINTLANSLRRSLGDLNVSLNDTKTILRRMQQQYEETNENADNKRAQKQTKNRLIRTFNETQKQYKQLQKRAQALKQSNNIDVRIDIPSRRVAAPVARAVGGNSSSSSSSSSIGGRASMSLNEIHSGSDSATSDGESTNLSRHQQTSYTSYQNTGGVSQTVWGSMDVASLAYEATERHEVIREIERDVQAVHAMFVDLNSMISEQQYMLDSIDSTIVTTAVKAEQASHELKKHEVALQKKRRRQCCLVLMLTLAGLVLLLMFWVLIR